VRATQSPSPRRDRQASYDVGMKVLDLRCADSHTFEGWFASEDDFAGQLQRGLVTCPLCGDHRITRLLSAPRLNLSGAREPVAHAPATRPADQPGEQAVVRAVDLQTAWMQTVQRLMKNTEDVGERFTEEARRIHYGEVPHRGIRGDATVEQRAALQDEGIEVMAIPVPAALKRPLQ
jgi:hypothetical protein